MKTNIKCDRCNKPVTGEDIVRMMLTVVQEHKKTMCKQCATTIIKQYETKEKT